MLYIYFGYVTYGVGGMKEIGTWNKLANQIYLNIAHMHTCMKQTSEIQKLQSGWF